MSADGLLPASRVSVANARGVRKRMRGMDRQRDGGHAAEQRISLDAARREAGRVELVSPVGVIGEPRSSELGRRPRTPAGLELPCGCRVMRRRLALA
jgi:hypothetical protein